jgi:hypothetical protein
MYNKKRKRKSKISQFLVKKTIKIVPKKYTCLNTTIKINWMQLTHRTLPRELSNGSKSTKRVQLLVVLGDFSTIKKTKTKNYLR